MHIDSGLLLKKRENALKKIKEFIAVSKGKKINEENIKPNPHTKALYIMFE